MRINQFKTYFLRLCLILVNNLFAILLFYFGTKSKIHIVHVQQEIQNQHSQDPYTTHIVHLYIHFQSFINDSLYNSSKSSDLHVFIDWLTYLDTWLIESQSPCQFLSCHDVRVWSFSESLLHLFKLKRRKGCSVKM